MKTEMQTRADLPGRIPEARFREYRRILFTHSWLIILAVLIVLAATLAYLKLTTPEYQAEAIMVREQEISDTISDRSGLGPLVPPMESVERQQLILKSRMVADEIVKQVAAYGFMVTLEQVRRNVSLDSITPRGDVFKITATSDDPRKSMIMANTAADVYISKLSELRSANLGRAETFLTEQLRVVNEKLQQAEEELNTFREREGVMSISGSKEGKSSGLLKQLGDLYAELSQVQNDQEFAKARLSAARQARDEKRREFTPLENNRLVPQIESLQSMIFNWQIELATLQETFTGKDPQVIELTEKIAAAQKQIDLCFKKLKEHGDSVDPLSEWQSLIQEVIQLDIQLRGYQQNESILKARIEKFKADHPQLIRKEIELTRLERTARIHEQTYMLLMEKYEEIRLLKRMNTAGVTIIDRAVVPESPISPNKRLTITLGILIGLTVGIGGAFLLEYADNSLRVEKDVERVLGLPVVGVVPIIQVEKATLKALKEQVNNNHNNGESNNGQQLPARKRRHSKKYQDSLAALRGRIVSNLDPKSPVAESYRTLWTNIQFARLDEKVGAILVSSPGPGEGKTLTVANLAITMARMGVKTLVMDTDLRRPRLHRIFQRDREPGLSDLLADGNTVNAQEQQLVGKSNNPHILSDYISSTDVENLYFLPSGKKPPNPAEILSSERMRQLVRELRPEFDMILFDSPPIVPVTDAAMMASEIADIVLLVVRSGETRRDIAQKAQELLEMVGANVFGVVLNTVDYAKQYGSYYYYYYYHYYYSHDEKEV
jgi:succinoglycan biosynthesis transport protein ExoP